MAKHKFPRKEMEVVDKLVEVKEEIKVEEPKAQMVQGVVNCALLNIRSKPSLNSKVETIISRGQVIAINLDKSTPNFYSVYYDGISGFCMKQFINTKDKGV